MVLPDVGFDFEFEHVYFEWFGNNPLTSLPSPFSFAVALIITEPSATQHAAGQTGPKHLKCICEDSSQVLGRLVHPWLGAMANHRDSNFYESNSRRAVSNTWWLGHTKGHRTAKQMWPVSTSPVELGQIHCEAYVCQQANPELNLTRLLS